MPGGPNDPLHDARLRRGVIDTAVSRSVAAAVTALFLALVYGVPVSQAVLEKIRGEDSTLLPMFERAPTRDHLRQFEKDLEQGSYAKDFVQPRMQWLLSRFGGAGNRRALIGRGGFLYYAPGLTHLVGPSFLDHDAIRLREREAQEGDGTLIHPDPLPAIFAFHDMLARRGIRLILFPVPDKTTLQPVELHGRFDSAKSMPVARNLGWKTFADALRKAGIELFDPAPSSLEPGEAPRYLIGDTHWTPQWMEQVARELARVVTKTAVRVRNPARPLHTVARSVHHAGDLVDMLKLPEGRSLFPPQAVTVHQVQEETGASWDPDPTAEVLLLGDSFTNVYSVDIMGWGESAGLGAQLALALGSDVDVIAQNDSGAFATRQMLFRALLAGEDRLLGKRVVIWEFASRELSVGDWKLIDWHTVEKQGAK
jgi:hypothetical protein